MSDLSPARAENVGVWRQRFGYGIADFACNLVWQVITLYLMYFYTDVIGLVAAEVGTLFLVTRLIDGVADVGMGVLIDRTKSRWGKSRPWFLWGAIPFGLLATATFSVPHAGHTAELAYAFATYLALSVAYTMVNIPLASILPSLTRDPHERTVLATTRIVFAFCSATTVSFCMLPLVHVLGGGSKRDGFFWTMLIFSVVGTLMLIYTFANVEEKARVRHSHVTVKQALSSLRGNIPWYIFAVNILFMWSAAFMQAGALIYYFTYNVGRPDLVSTVAALSASVPILGTFATPFLARKWHKRTMFMVGSSIVLAGIIIMIVAQTHVTGLIVGVLIGALGSGLRMSIFFSMQADPVDYGEWKTGISAAGILSSANGFIGKVALAGAGAISGWTLTLSHYVPNHPQQASALFAIKLNYLILPAGLVVVSMIIMSFYNLDKIYPKIRAEIDARADAHLA